MAAGRFATGLDTLGCYRGPLGHVHIVVDPQRGGRASLWQKPRRFSAHELEVMDAKTPPPIAAGIVVRSMETVLQPGIKHQTAECLSRFPLPSSADNTGARADDEPAAETVGAAGTPQPASAPRATGSPNTTTTYSLRTVADTSSEWEEVLDKPHLASEFA